MSKVKMKNQATNKQLKMRNIFNESFAQSPQYREGKKEFYKRCRMKYQSKYNFLTKSQINTKIKLAWKNYQEKQGSLHYICIFVYLS